jgi:hypothetical protein
MTAKFFDRNEAANPMNGCTVVSERQLLDLLDSYENRRPFFCELQGESHTLLLGVGPTGCIQYNDRNGSPPYLMAMIPDGQQRKGYLEFLMGDTPTPVLMRYALPLSRVKEVAVYFLESGKRSPSVSWEGI